MVVVVFGLSLILPAGHLHGYAEFSSKQIFFQRFRKGVGGQRGLVRGTPSYARDSGIFPASFFLFLP